MASLCSSCRQLIRQFPHLAVRNKWTPSSQLPRSNAKKNRRPDEIAEEMRNTSPGDKKTGRSRLGDYESLPPSMRSKFKLFKDEEEEVLDSAQLQWTVTEAPVEEGKVDIFEGLPLERGKRGVFDIHELVDVLRLENAVNVFVAEIPPELQYAEYLVLVSGKSRRHLLSMAEFIAKYYKAKKHKSDPFLTNSVTSWKSEDWIPLDFGNIVLHFMDTKLREQYDIESLWALGTEHDPHSQKQKDRTMEMIENASRLVTDISKPLVRADRK